MTLLESFYELTLESLKHAKNERLWFKTNTKLANLYLQSADWNALSNVLKVFLHPSRTTKPFVVLLYKI